MTNFKIHTTPDGWIHMTPEHDHEYTYIFLHGFGSKAQILYDKWFKNGTFAPNNCKIVIGNAPVRTYSGKNLNSWYNMNADFD